MRDVSATVIDFNRARRARQVRDQPRREGRFTSGRTREETLEIIREGALIAAAHFGCEPERVQQHHFDRVRYQLEHRHGRLPQARELVRQLRQATGQPFQWRIWVGIATDEAKDFRKVVMKLAQPPIAEVTPGDVTFAVRAAAQELNVPTISEDDYERGQRSIIARAERSGRGRAAAEARLPTSNQIMTACGSWNAALELAGLPPLTPDTRRRRGLPIPDSIVLYYAKRGAFPTGRQLEKFMQAEGIAMSRMAGVPYEEWIERARKRATDFPQLPPPPDYGTPEPDDWTPVAVEIELPQRGRKAYTREEVIQAVGDFLDWVPPRVTITGRRYREFQKGKRGVPSLHAILEHGSLDELVDEARASRAAEASAPPP